MNNRLILILPALAATVAQVGCGNPPGLCPVYGTVLYKGQPAAGAVVYFHQEGPSASQSIPFGIVEDDGRFNLTCDSQGNGCPPGKYAVLVEWRDAAGDGVVPVKTTGRAKGKLVKRSRVRSGPDRLGGRYFDIGKPLLHVEVLPRSNTLAPFELDG